MKYFVREVAKSAKVSLLIIWIILSSCQQKPETRHVKEIDLLFREQFKETEPGGAVRIMKGEKIIFSKGYGLADLTTKDKISSQTLFNTGSISKTFISNAILQLADEGKL